jgi:speckle-type POZ protein
MEDKEVIPGGGVEASLLDVMPMLGAQAWDMAASPTSSRSVTQMMNDSLIRDPRLLLAKGMGVGRHIASETFTVGGYWWAIYLYPDQKNPEDNSTYLSRNVFFLEKGIY